MRSSLALLGLLLVACGGGEDTDTDTDTDANGPAPTFTEVRQTVFPSCSQPTCHGSADASGVLLTADISADTLVDTPAVGAPDEILVIPGDPDNSYLVKKIEGAPDIVGDPMPPPFGGLPEEHVQLVRDWIAAGAADD